MAPVTHRAVVRWWARPWALTRQALCPHTELYRVTEAGVRYFRCECGYQVPQLRRSPAEQERAHALLRGSAK